MKVYQLIRQCMEEITSNGTLKHEESWTSQELGLPAPIFDVFRKEMEDLSGGSITLLGDITYNPISDTSVKVSRNTSRIYAMWNLDTSISFYRTPESLELEQESTALHELFYTKIAQLITDGQA